MKIYQIKSQISKWKLSYRKSRKEETIIALIRIGHTYLTYSYIYKKRVHQFALVKHQKVLCLVYCILLLYAYIFKYSTDL